KTLPFPSPRCRERPHPPPPPPPPGATVYLTVATPVTALHRSWDRSQNDRLASPVLSHPVAAAGTAGFGRKIKKTGRFREKIFSIFSDFSGHQILQSSRIEHTLRLPPHLLSLRLEDAVRGELEKLFLDKVIANLGLCISVHSIQSIKDGFILPNDGHPTFRAILTLCIDGLLFDKEACLCLTHMSLEFFDDIYVPVHLLPVPSHSVPDPGKRDRVMWIWKFPDSDEELIKFQVHSVNFPPIPIEQPEDSKPFAPMVVTGSIDFDGLGPVSWWVDAEDKDEEPEDP
ncbi:RNA polymerase Rpb7 N-terminal domain-containing protein, partial [Prunus dulcis]